MADGCSNDAKRGSETDLRTLSVSPDLWFTELVYTKVI